MKIKIWDRIKTVETCTIKVSFPFYAKRVGYHNSYLKFLNESHYYEISITKKEDRDSKRMTISYGLSLEPSERELVEGSKPNYNRSNAYIIMKALHNEEQYSISTEEEFNTALEQYKKYVSDIATCDLDSHPKLNWRGWKLDKVRDKRIDKLVE
jgi:hypothetical protein